MTDGISVTEEGTQVDRWKPSSMRDEERNNRSADSHDVKVEPR
jgi:hypothetical protein